MKLPFLLLFSLLWLLGCSSPSTQSPAGAQQARPGSPVTLINASFSDGTGAELMGWTAHQHVGPPSYEITRDLKSPKSAPASARIHRFGPEFYGALDQRILAKPEWIGKIARLSGYLRVAEVNGKGAALSLQAINGGGNILAHDHMDTRRVTGTRDWARYDAQVKLPPGTYFIKVGVMLEDGGTLWADDLALDIVD